jgi:hypothetical protein
MTTTLVQQLILVSASGALLGVAAIMARRGMLSFGTAVMWIGIGVLGLVAAILVPFVGRLGLFLGLLPAAVLAAAASAVLVVIAFSLSVRVSSLESSLQATAERVAIDRASAEPSQGPPTGTVAIVPAFNEAPSVGRVVASLRDLGLPVIVVDDGSTDGTSAIARAEGATVVSLPTNLGVGGALRAGIRLATRMGYEQVVQCDADGQHPSDAVRSLLRSQAEDPHDLLLGSRFTDDDARRDEPLVRRTAMRLLAAFASRATGVRITDATSGLRVIRQPLLGELATHIPRHYLGDTFEVLISAGRAGFRIAEHPVEMQERAHGASTASFAAALGLTLRAILVALLRGHARLRR